MALHEVYSQPDFALGSLNEQSYLAGRVDQLLQSASQHLPRLIITLLPQAPLLDAEIVVVHSLSPQGAVQPYGHIVNGSDQVLGQ